ncbi:hypothetical protein LINPERHAP2_LOCUS3324 [Linum perenne]
METRRNEEELGLQIFGGRLELEERGRPKASGERQEHSSRGKWVRRSSEGKNEKVGGDGNDDARSGKHGDRRRSFREEKRPSKFAGVEEGVGMAWNRSLGFMELVTLFGKSVVALGERVTSLPHQKVRTWVFFVKLLKCWTSLLNGESVSVASEIRRKCSIWAPEVLKCCSSVLGGYLSRLMSKRHTVRTGGIKTTRRFLSDIVQSLQLG